jgi:hypothetical protein
VWWGGPQTAQEQNVKVEFQVYFKLLRRYTGVSGFVVVVVIARTEARKSDGERWGDGSDVRLAVA